MKTITASGSSPASPTSVYRNAVTALIVINTTFTGTTGMNSRLVRNQRPVPFPTDFGDDGDVEVVDEDQDEAGDRHGHIGAERAELRGGPIAERLERPRRRQRGPAEGGQVAQHGRQAPVVREPRQLGRGEHERARQRPEQDDAQQRRHERGVERCGATQMRGAHVGVEAEQQQQHEHRRRGSSRPAGARKTNAGTSASSPVRRQSERKPRVPGAQHRKTAERSWQQPDRWSLRETSHVANPNRLHGRGRGALGRSDVQRLDCLICCDGTFGARPVRASQQRHGQQQDGQDAKAGDRETGPRVEQRGDHSAEHEAEAGHRHRDRLEQPRRPVPGTARR